MDFLAAVIAIVAIILAFRLRKRVTTLEAHVALLYGRLDAKPDGAPQAAGILLPEQPATPEPEAQKPETAAPAVSVPQSPPPSARSDEAAPPPEPPFPAQPALPTP